MLGRAERVGVYHLPAAVVRVDLLVLVRRQLGVRQRGDAYAIVAREVLEKRAHDDEGYHALAVRESESENGEEDDDEK